MKPKRVFIGPCEVAGYYANLARGLNEIGVKCDYITYRTHPFGYESEARLPVFIRLARRFNRYRGRKGRPWLLQVLIALPGEAISALWGLYAISKYDIFIFGFGRSLISMRNIDLWILNLFGKTVVTNLAHGSEARPTYMDGFCQEKDAKYYPSIRQMSRQAKAARLRVARHQLYSDYTIGAPFSTCHFAQGKIINIFALGVPFTGNCAIGDAQEEYCGPHDHGVCRILHSPSHPAAKGSSLVIKAIGNLKENGYAIDLVLLNNVSHAEVIREIQRCDFVVDQGYSDTPMAGFAAEAAWFGKPAVVGGYGLEQLKALVPEGMWPPSRTCHPDSIQQAIESLIVNREERLSLGAKAQKFVREKWSAAEVARRYLRIIEGNIPDEWWLEPRSVTYLEGAGQPIERTQNNVRRMVSEYGTQSLQLRHRPDLEQAFLEFAGKKPVH